MKPQAFITVRKNRIKSYNKNQHFLADKQEYEIELYNPDSNVYLAKIYVDGTDLSGNGTGIILRPGERVFLERFLNTSKKFAFSSYEVGSSKEVKKAISNNGRVVVTYIKEFKPVNPITITTSWGPYWSNGNNYFTYGTCTGTGNIEGATFTNTSAMLSQVTMDSFDNSLEPIKTLSKKKIVTGRTEQGSESDQNFNTVSGYEWESFTTVTYEYRLLPLETKSLSVSEVKTVYCTGCGTKAKKGWKYCATCGEKV